MGSRPTIEPKPEAFMSDALLLNPVLMGVVKETVSPDWSVTTACTQRHVRYLIDFWSSSALASMQTPCQPKSRSRVRVLERCRGSFEARSMKNPPRLSPCSFAIVLSWPD